MMVSRKAIIVALLGLVYSNKSWALTSDKQQPIAVVSQQQSIAFNDHRMVFSGQVVVTQGSMVIRADRAVVTRTNNQPGWERVEATGSPVTFYQQLDNQQIISGSGRCLRYNAQTGMMILQQQAMLKMGDNQMDGNRITYDLHKQQVQAASQANGRVKMVLQPKQFQKKTKPACGQR